MGNKFVKNPSSQVIHAIPEEIKEKIAALEMELVRERAVKKSGIKEVIKVEEKIVYKDDPDLLKRFNEAMAELGKYKMDKKSLSVVTKDTVIQEVPVYREVKKEVMVLDKKKAILISAISFFAGSAFILIIEKLIGFPIM